MLAGAGANLQQQWGLAPWIGSLIMAVGVLVVSLLDVEKVTNVLGSITPFIIALLLAAAIYTFVTMPSDFSSAAQFANDNVVSTLPNWWVSSLNYIGIALMGGISMGIVMVVAMIFNVEGVYQESLPTLAIIDQIHPWLGIFASFVIYLMIFSTALGNIYSLGKRLTAKHPQRFLPVLIILVAVGYALSFLDFATLVGSVFPVMGYVALVMITVLFASWLGRGRGIVTKESRRRDKIRDLVLRMIDPNEKFTTAQRRELSREIFRSNISDTHLRETIVADVIEELDADDSNDFSAEDYEVDEDWIQGTYEPLRPGQVRVVNESVLVNDEGWGVVGEEEQK